MGKQSATPTPKETTTQQPPKKEQKAKKQGGSLVSTIFILFALSGLGFFAYQNLDKIQAAFETKVDENVQILTDSSFDSVIASNEYVLVEFFAPWCGHCKQLAPEYSRAAATLKQRGSSAVLATVDATVQKECSSKFDIKGFPTLKFFENGVVREYNGGRTSGDILSWISKATGDSSTHIQSVEQLESFVAEEKILVVLFTQQTSGSEFDNFKTVATQTDKITFAHVTSQEVAGVFEAQLGQVLIFKKFDEPRLVLKEELSVENISAFIQSNRVPTTFEFDNDAIELVFQTKQSTFMIFYDESAQESVQAKQVFDSLAASRKGKIQFSYSRPTDVSGHYNKLGEFLGVDVNLAPQFAIVDTSSGQIVKFVYSGEQSEQAIANYIDSFVSGDLKPTLKSEEIPAENNEAVRVLVGKNFETEVINNDKDVLVKFYAPWCGHCKTLAPFWDEAAEKLRNVNSNIVIAKMDSTLNEISQVAIEGFPTLKFFPGNDKSNIVDFNGQRTTEGILEWLQQHTTHPWVSVDEQQNNNQASEDL